MTTDNFKGLKAKVTVDDKFLKENAYLFIGSEVTILKTRGACYSCITNAGQEITLRESEIKIKNKIL